LAFYRDDEKGRIPGKVSEVGNDEVEGGPDQSFDDAATDVIYKLKKTRQAAKRLNDNLLLHLIDMATLQVSEALTEHFGPDERQRKSTG